MGLILPVHQIIQIYVPIKPLKNCSDINKQNIQGNQRQNKNVQKSLTNEKKLLAEMLSSSHNLI